ncbi:ABC transporter substrate-binding protein [Streptomyces sp. SID4919]|uniref:iron-siderophore ABC transporter substrate-binding protein n=1 Tax=unclassified Streptomyces TaxID=2593676 RepID=UPI0008238AE8|nr:MULTISPECIES: iron-siderophore ABC transporter substrate-binding protein [unclassified Streptomyces]MYY07417.1 ABC transporter substrate-binding protein [Streptomyces sp. SID4919]SCK60485.1 iron complex transport system substrate-binding protein [Streptomyces sp. AmelKG-E11A]
MSLPTAVPTAAAPTRTPRRARVWTRAAGLAFAAALVLTGCGAGSSAEGSEGDGKAAGKSAAAFPVSIKHAHGTTRITEKPKRVVAVSWMNQDIVTALGVLPVGVDKQWGGDKDGHTPWFRTAAEKLGGELPETLNYGDSGEMDFEQILSLEPDLIVGLYSGISDVDYKRLTEIAPTIPYLKRPYDGGTWQDMTRTIGKALGENTKAEQLVTKTEGVLADVARENPQFKGKTFTYGTALTPGSTEAGLYVDYDPRVRLLIEMGFENTPSAEVINAGVKGTNFYGGVSLEKLDTVKADVFVGWAYDPKEVPYSLKDPLFKRWKPIAEKRYAFVETAELGMAVSGPTVLSIPWALERYVPLLADAVAGKGRSDTQGS